MDNQNEQISVVPPTQPEAPKKSNRILLAIASVLGVLALSAIVFFVFPKDKMSAPQAKKTSEQQVLSPTPTPIPFDEMTIPSLRKRGYRSELGNLEQVSVNSSYTSYRTNYLSDGLKINGQLTIPREDMPIEGWGAIIFIHGYIPPDSYQTFQNYSSYVDYLARSGFVVFKIDLRGHGDSEGEPGGAYYSADYIIDVLNARAALMGADFVNQEKIGLWGHSMAGNVVLRSLAVMPEIPAASIWGGAVFTYDDWQKYGIDDGSYRPPANATNSQNRRQRLSQTHGQFDASHPFWSRFAPTRYLSDIKGAIQLNHTIDDAVVNVGYSRDLAELLKTTAVSYEFHEYPSGGHNFVGSAFGSAMQNTVDFFNENL